MPSPSTTWWRLHWRNRSSPGSTSRAGRSTWRCWSNPTRPGSRSSDTTRTWSSATGFSRGGPTLAEYRERHEELNLRCQGQAYILRASWFRYVDEELGRDVVLNLAAARDSFDPAPVEAVLGASLEQVDADWAAWATARYEAHADAEGAVERYLGSMRWYEPCLE